MDKFTRTANHILSEKVYIFTDEDDNDQYEPEESPADDNMGQMEPLDDEDNEHQDIKSMIIDLLTKGKREEATKILMSFKIKDPEGFNNFIKQFEQESIPSEQESITNRAEKIDGLAGAIDLVSKLGITPQKRFGGFVSGAKNAGKEMDALLGDVAKQLKGFRKGLK